MVLTTQQAAKRLGINQSRVSQLINKGIIKATKLGRDWFINDTDLMAAKWNRKPGPKTKPKRITTGFYVYVLRRPDKIDPIEPWNFCPFYVGMGQDNRVDQHRKDAFLIWRSGPCNKSREFIEINPKIAIIFSLWEQELDFEEDIVIENCSEREARTYESQMIHAYGRLGIDKNGCLTNKIKGNYL